MSVLLAENVHELGYGEVTVLVDEALGTGGETLNTKISILQDAFSYPFPISCEKLL